ncbi:unnamed protein product [Trypanosoma congolense IL3000]|uniref:WGS project CAEQ00000000 data, annotated contig 19 n=1 Tax=Trypanosoma congolense (strain IL3000) TaxID=1068625 RepID=F9W9Z6_TRYCI|nr:unnamed protein product [Trypanosoma congolense IL3000]
MGSAAGKIKEDEQRPSRQGNSTGDNTVGTRSATDSELPPPSCDLPQAERTVEENEEDASEDEDKCCSSYSMDSCPQIPKRTRRVSLPGDDEDGAIGSAITKHHSNLARHHRPRRKDSANGKGKGKRRPSVPQQKFDFATAAKTLSSTCSIERQQRRLSLERQHRLSAAGFNTNDSKDRRLTRPCTPVARHYSSEIEGEMNDLSNFSFSEAQHPEQQVSLRERALINTGVMHSPQTVPAGILRKSSYGPQRLSCVLQPNGADNSTASDALEPPSRNILAGPRASVMMRASSADALRDHGKTEDELQRITLLIQQMRGHKEREEGEPVAVAVAGNASNCC